jgi:two-component system invasion response regulator UvrY
MRVLIVDDHHIVRMGVRNLIEHNHWQVCGEAVDGEDALAKVGVLAPDVVILDLTLPKLSGYDIAPQIRQISPFSKIIVFSMHDVPTIAKHVGADAFVAKSSAPHDLITAIMRVMKLEENASRATTS